MAKFQRLCVVPIHASKEPRYMLAYVLRSRNGIMVKHFTGVRPFPESKLVEVKKHLGSKCVVDLRIA